MDWYGEALAAVHDQDFTGLARAAAATSLELLPPPERSGLVVDLGCGSGAAAADLVAAGYRVSGIDLSPAMIELARAGVPGGDFSVGSIYDAAVPDCQAVLAIGEIFNYASEDRTEAALTALLERIRAALVPGGFLLTDVAGPGRSSAASGDRMFTSADWEMRVETSEDGETFTRRITTTTAAGTTTETHVLELLPPADFGRRLTEAGFDADPLPGYQDFPLPTGWTAWLARAAG